MDQKATDEAPTKFKQNWLKPKREFRPLTVKQMQELLQRTLLSAQSTSDEEQLSVTSEGDDVLLIQVSNPNWQSQVMRIELTDDE